MTPESASPEGASRRALLRFVGTAGLATLAACTSSPTTHRETTGSDESSAAVTHAAARRVLLAYFSRAGENYWYGKRRTLTIGNTEVLAQLIATRIGCDTRRIEAADPYPNSYDDTVARNLRGQNDDARPAIANPPPDLTGYDAVILASPIWNVRPPMIMSTFVDAVDLTGKTVYPVVTHAMSGLGRAPAIYTAAAPTAVLSTGLAIQGERVNDADDDVAGWVQSITP